MPMAAVQQVGGNPAAGGQGNPGGQMQPPPQ